MWLAAAILSSVFAGLTAILAKCGIKKTDSDIATAIRTVVVLAFSWLMVFVAGCQNHHTDQFKFAVVFDPVWGCNGRFVDVLF